MLICLLRHGSYAISSLGWNLNPEIRPPRTGCYGGTGRSRLANVCLLPAVKAGMPIASLIRTRPREAERAVEDLADLFRAALNSPDQLTTLGEELLRLWSETRKTVIFITHSIDEALVLGDRVIVMSRRPGHLKAEFRIDFARPRRIYDLKADAEFGRISREIWMLLREEVGGA